MIEKTIDYWYFTQLVKERIAITPVIAFVEKHFGSDWNYNIFKSKKTSVLLVSADQVQTRLSGGVTLSLLTSKTYLRRPRSLCRV